MSVSQQIGKQFKDVIEGGNWTAVNLKETLAGITFQQATTKFYSFNTIAALVYHIDYYIDAILKVLQDQPLNAHDKYSFDHPPVSSQKDWESLLQKTWADAESLAVLISNIPDEKLWQTFVHEKYGSYYRNFCGLTEHTHYHLGQIVLIKKLFKTEII